MNVIIVMSDTLRTDHVGAYGNKWIKTPNMDRFAAESMVFDRAVPESLPTIPVRRAMLTGMRVFPFTKEVFASGDEAAKVGATFLGRPKAIMPGWEPIPWDQATIPEMLRGPEALRYHLFDEEGGYRTVFITDSCPYFQSAVMNFHRGFSHWEFIRGQESDTYGVSALAKKLDIDRWVPPYYKNTRMLHIMEKYLANTWAKWQGEEDHFAPQTFRTAIQWLEDSREAQGPFFLLVDTWDPHEPFDPPQHYVDLYDPGYDGVEVIMPGYGPWPTELMSEKEMKHSQALYAGEVTMVDTWFGKFMDKVSELGLLDDTLIILTSDHGGQLGEHGIWGKCPAAMYNQVVDCVLMIRHPQGIGSGQRSDALVQHHDICTTVLNFLGVSPPYELDGKDLMPLVEGKKTKVRDYATCGYVLNVWARDDEYVFISLNDGEEPQLFDMKNDPGQLHNIAADKSKIVKRMFDLILDDAQGGPILPNFKIDTSDPINGWMLWSPYHSVQRPL
ncbi:MAG: sulfatase [Dehalococcoidia bacterium]|nr:sulfatase [Dehalococcoidia bacterium]